MNRPLNALPAAENNVRVLAVSPFDEDHRLLRNIFRHSNWNLHGTRTRFDALDMLRKNYMPVVLCERKLPDGDWKNLLDWLKSLVTPPNLIVTSRLADDRLWMEVLNWGGYDVLAKPFRPQEVLRVISLAWRSWKSEWERRHAQFATAAGLAI